MPGISSFASSRDYRFETGAGIYAPRSGQPGILPVFSEGSFSEHGSRDSGDLLPPHCQIAGTVAAGTFLPPGPIGIPAVWYSITVMIAGEIVYAVTVFVHESQRLAGNFLRARPDL